MLGEDNYFFLHGLVAEEKTHPFFSVQIMATSQDQKNPKGRCGREIPLFQGNLGS